MEMCSPHPAAKATYNGLAAEAAWANMSYKAKYTAGINTRSKYYHDWYLFWLGGGNDDGALAVQNSSSIVGNV